MIEDKDKQLNSRKNNRKKCVYINMAQVGNKYFNNISGVGETPIYQRTGGGAGNNETSNLGVLNASFSTNAFKSAGLPDYAWQHKRTILRSIDQHIY
jgi:hypothetical protein